MNDPRKIAFTPAQGSNAPTVDLGSYGEWGRFDPSVEPPAIEDFKMDAPVSDGVGSPMKTHMAEVQLEGDVEEDRVMQYILGIRDKLNVRVKSFNWNVKDEKPTRKASTRLLRVASGLDKYGHAASDHLRKIAQEVMDLGSFGEVESFDPSHEPPAIESFVRKKDGKGVGGRPPKVHTVEVVFEGNVEEDRIMQYLLGIRDHLNLRVKSFNWSVKEDKSSNEA
jgi:hypothetical protein